MTKTDAIRNRSLSRRDIDKLNALASRGGEDVAEQPKPASPAVPAPEPETTETPKSIEGLVKHYYNAFRKVEGFERDAAILTQAAMELEGAALIAKAIKDK